ncbi:MAG: hypothetical protein CMH54_15595 [Myxococcales bacterium]|nr:hypothetical protein [Myxococcales bacterium]
MADSNPAPEFFVIDVEATGPNLIVHSLIEIGVVHAGNLENTFHCRLKPPEGGVVSSWVEETIPDVLAAARETGQEPKAAAEALKEWVVSITGDKPAVMVGYVTGLDWRGICELFERELGPDENPFHYKHVDIYPLAMGALGVPWGFSREEMDVWLEIPPLPEGEAHHALNDARQHALEFNALVKMLGPRWAASALGLPGEGET